MHELSIAEDLSIIVLDTALHNNLKKITRVNIILGQMTQISPDSFEFAFRETVRNSIAGGAELNIEILPMKMKCMNCGSDFQPKENRFTCSLCNSNDIQMIQGKELFVKSIEGE